MRETILYAQKDFEWFPEKFSCVKDEHEFVKLEKKQVESTNMRGRTYQYAVLKNVYLCVHCQGKFCLELCKSTIAS